MPSARVRRSKKIKGLIFVISGPSGSGKSTLLDRILADPDLKMKLRRSVSFTTRPKRSGERSGQHYFFIKEDKFKEHLKDKKILEWTKYLGYYYGTPRDFFKNSLTNNKHIALCLDYKGALQVKKLYPENTKTIFVLPPSLDLLGERIKNRCSRTKHEEINRRLALAKKEVTYSKKYDYSLVNKDLKDAVGELKKIVLEEISKYNQED